MDNYKVLLKNQKLFVGSYEDCQTFVESVRSSMDGEYFGLPAEDAAYSCSIEKLKTLYFEGAGMESADISKATVGNCRIRTAFHLDNGDKVYLELSGKFADKRRECERPFVHAGFVDFCYLITYDGDDCNKHALPYQNDGKCFEYDHKGILEVVNSLGASFKQIKVLPKLAGYRVFGHKASEYNYGDQFEPNWQVIKTAKEIEKHFDIIDKQGAGHFSIWNDDKDVTKIHVQFFKGGKHMLFDALADDWQASKKEME